MAFSRGDAEEDVRECCKGTSHLSSMSTDASSRLTLFFCTRSKLWCNRGPAEVQPLPYRLVLLGEVPEGVGLCQHQEKCCKHTLL